MPRSKFETLRGCFHMHNGTPKGCSPFGQAWAESPFQIIAQRYRYFSLFILHHSLFMVHDGMNVRFVLVAFEWRVCMSDLNVSMHVLKELSVARMRFRSIFIQIMGFQRDAVPLVRLGLKAHSKSSRSDTSYAVSGRCRRIVSRSFSQDASMLPPICSMTVFAIARPRPVECSADSTV